MRRVCDYYDRHSSTRREANNRMLALDDHTLYIWSQHGGYTLTLLDDNDTVVYQTYVAAGVQFCALPSTLSGSYTLQLHNDTYLFTGYIDL